MHLTQYVCTSKRLLAIGGTCSVCFTCCAFDVAWGDYRYPTCNQHVLGRVNAYIWLKIRSDSGITASQHRVPDLGLISDSASRFQVQVDAILCCGKTDIITEVLAMLLLLLGLDFLKSWFKKMNFHERCYTNLHYTLSWNMVSLNWLLTRAGFISGLDVYWSGKQFVCAGSVKASKTNQVKARYSS